MIQPVEFRSIADATDGSYRNEILTSVNDHQVLISVMEAPYFWHIHPDSDETFIAIDGTLIIDFDDGMAELSPGQMLTIPAGVRHRTRPATRRTVNLTIERRSTTTVRSDVQGLSAPPEAP